LNLFFKLSEETELETRVVQQFGSVIRARRRQLDLTQQELARRVGTSVPYIGHLETEKRHPSEKIVTRLAEVLGLDPRELFFLANPGTKHLISRDQESNGETAWNAFCREEIFRKIHNITEQEMQALSGVALLGEVRTPRDFLFILNTIRHALVEKR
jgi:transcriptional regulator with XRE-family HTH domain